MNQQQQPSEMTKEQMRAEIAKLQAEISKAAQAERTSFSLKVSEKGAVSAYGMGRFPVTLYAGQWETLLANAEQIKAFIQANKAKLATKPAK